MDRENIMFVLFRSIRLLQDVTGEIAFLNHDMLDGLCSCRIAEMACLNPNAQIIVILLPPVVFHFKKDPIKQPCFVTVYQLRKYAVVLVDQSEASCGFELP